jgi:hypothetical protein
MKKIWAEIKYWVFILIFLAVLFELVASMILFRKYTTGTLAITHFNDELFKKGAGQKMYDMHKLSRPGVSDDVNKMIADETKDADQYSYEPWLMFRVADYHSKYVNVSGFERKSVPGTYIKTGSADTIDIYFFGGSTMYGYNLADNETIPSRFINAYRQENPAASLRVKNFGIPHYYSKQELMLLSSLLFEGHRPDIVIFLDGLNDFYPSRMLYYDRPYFSYALQQAFEGKMFQKGKNTFLDSTGQFYDDPPVITGNEYNDQLIKSYNNNIRMAAELCKNAGIKSYFFCQPVPFYKNVHLSSHSYKGNFKRFDYIYPELEKNKDSLNNFYFLGNSLENEKGNAFIDSMNYSPEFSEKIAKQILSTVKKDLE